MKSFFVSIIFFISTVAIAYYYNPQVFQQIFSAIPQPCSKPITYKIGSVDPKYGVSEEEFKQDIEKAADIWEVTVGKKLYSYNPEGEIKINLIYDERQKSETAVKTIKSDLNTKKSEFIPTKEKYEVAVANLKKKISDLNNEINSWNEKGGAPEDTYKDLTKRQEELKQEIKSINEAGKQLNSFVSEYNEGVLKLKDAADDLNITLQNKPEEGIYDHLNKEISIFLIINKNELIHTLAHELGHGLELAHNTDPKSIMYPYTTSTTKVSTDDIAAIEKVCNSSIIERLRNKFQTIKFRGINFLNS